jgi:hypothetical protein
LCWNTPCRLRDNGITHQRRSPQTFAVVRMSP